MNTNLSLISVTRIALFRLSKTVSLFRLSKHGTLQWLLDRLTLLIRKAHQTLQQQMYQLRNYIYYDKHLNILNMSHKHTEYLK